MMMIGRQKLPSIIYKNFRFPFNPETTSYKADRTYIKHKYPELTGTELEDLGANACIISGSGVFSGPTAYALWRQLLSAYKEPGVGTLFHPIFTDVTRGLMVSLTGTVDPIDDYISYSFEIVADTPPSVDECLGKYIIIQDPVPSDDPSNGNGNGNGGGGGIKGEFVHTVVKGECLSVICARYACKYKTTISWQKIATHNAMKNPHLIFPGDKIKIYYPT